MEYKSINIKEKFSRFNEHWTPKVIAEMNNYQFKISKLQGDFVWHKHEDTDETFIVMAGEMVIEFRDGKVKLKKGEMFVVPKNTEHKPYAETECHLLIIEPRGVVNTGDIENNLTAENDIWI